MDDLTGNWKITRCEVFINNVLYKSSYLNDEMGLNNVVMESKNIGTLDEEINTVMKTITGTGIYFNSDSTLAWDASLSEIKISNASWQLTDAGEIIVCELKNRDKIKPLVIFRIIFIQADSIYLKTYVSGLEIRLKLGK
jgi:hypothetical protein